MRKRLVKPAGPPAAGSNQDWLDLEQIATVEVTSENPDFPIEAVFSPVDSTGWRAQHPGEQTIRLLFDESRPLRHVQLAFSDTTTERTQEFCLRWGGENGDLREIVRQQWTFSPGGATTEVEDYEVGLQAVKVLELWLRPDGNGQATATMLHWRVA